MRLHAHKVGAVLFGLWGVMHAAGGATMLLTLIRHGPTSMLAMFGWSPVDDLGGVAGILTFHAWNLLWIGLLSALVAFRLNWRNDPLGYWLNMAVIGAANLGAIFALVLPGHLDAGAAAPGIALWLLAVLFSTRGRRFSSV